MKLKNKVIIVTGGSRGIGAACAKKATQEGAKVVIAATNIGNLEKCKAHIKETTGADVDTLVMDVGCPKAIRKGIDEVYEKYHRVDGLVNSAGIIRRTPFLEIPEDEWKQIYDIDVMGTFIACQQAAKYMKENRSGSIVNISSVLAKYPGEQMVAYNSAKAAVNMMTETMAVELGEYGIRCNCIGPGIVVTDMTSKRRSDPEAVKGWLQRIALNRLAKAEDIANMAVFMLSEEASYMSGQIVYVDGGWKSY